MSDLPYQPTASRAPKNVKDTSKGPFTPAAGQPSIDFGGNTKLKKGSMKYQYLNESRRENVQAKADFKRGAVARVDPNGGSNPKNPNPKIKNSVKGES